MRTRSGQIYDGVYTSHTYKEHISDLVELIGMLNMKKPSMLPRGPNILLVILPTRLCAYSDIISTARWTSHSHARKFRKHDYTIPPLYWHCAYSCRTTTRLTMTLLRERHSRNLLYTWPRIMIVRLTRKNVVTTGTGPLSLGKNRFLPTVEGRRFETWFPVVVWRRNHWAVRRRPIEDEVFEK